jgi:hydrogenase/urease accessory protein HupE
MPWFFEVEELAKLVRARSAWIFYIVCDGLDLVLAGQLANSVLAEYCAKAVLVLGHAHGDLCPDLALPVEPRSDWEVCEFHFGVLGMGHSQLRLFTCFASAVISCCVVGR